MLSRNEFVLALLRDKPGDSGIENKKLLLKTYDELTTMNSENLNALQSLSMQVGINKKIVEIAMDFIDNELKEWVDVPSTSQVSEKNYLLSVIKDILSEII